MLVKHLFFSKKQTNSNSIFCNRKKKSISMFKSGIRIFVGLDGPLWKLKKKESKIKTNFSKIKTNFLWIVITDSTLHVNFMYIKISITEGNQVDPSYACKDLFIWMRCMTKRLTWVCFWTQLSSFSVHIVNLALSRRIIIIIGNREIIFIFLRKKYCAIPDVQFFT